MKNDRNSAQTTEKPADPSSAKLSEAAPSIYRYQSHPITSVLSLQTDAIPQDSASHNYLADAFQRI